MAIFLVLCLLVSLRFFLTCELPHHHPNRNYALIKMLDIGCQTYHTDFFTHPPTDVFNDSRALHLHLGSPRVLPSHTKPPIIEFLPDQLEPLPDGADPDTLRRLVDTWGNPIRYRNPGIHNPDGVDIWSIGKDGRDDQGAEQSDDITNWAKGY